MELDHVLIAVSDLTTAVSEFEARYGLTSIEGGRHPGWGTANRIVPLGDTYLELVAVVDADEAAERPFGRWVGRAAVPGAGRLMGWAVRTDDLDATARRLDLVVEAGSRIRADGRELRWRTGGVEAAVAEPFLPFFIEWGSGIVLPGQSAPMQPGSVMTLYLRGDPKRLAEWIGPHTLPIEIHSGSAAITSLVLAGLEDGVTAIVIGD